MKFMFLISFVIPSILAIITEAFKLCRVMPKSDKLDWKQMTMSRFALTPQSFRSMEYSSHTESLAIGIRFWSGKVCTRSTCCLYDLASNLLPCL